MDYIDNLLKKILGFFAKISLYFSVFIIAIFYILFYNKWYRLNNQIKIITKLKKNVYKQSV